MSPSDTPADEADQPEVEPEEALHVAQRALVKANRVDDLEKRLAEAEDDLAQLSLRLSSFDEDRDYGALSRDDKIGRVREYGFERATDDRGRVFDVNDIREGLFDGLASRDHCYDLMRWAAEARGFEYKEPSGRNNCLVVDPAEARRGVLYSATTAPQGEARSG